MLATFNQFIQPNGIYYACVEEKYKVRKVTMGRSQG